MDDQRVVTASGLEAKPAEHPTRSGIFRQHVGRDLPEAGRARQVHQMPRQHHADALALAGIDYDESDFGSAGLDQDLARTDDDRTSITFFDGRNQRRRD